MLEIELQQISKIMQKSLRQTAKSLGISHTSLTNGLLGYGMKYEHALRLRQVIETLRLGGPYADVSAFLPRDLSLYYRFAAHNPAEGWVAFDTYICPECVNGVWRYQFGIPTPPKPLTGLSLDIPGDTSPPEERLYQRDLETHLWFKVGCAYNSSRITNEEVAAAIKHPKLLNHAERYEKTKLYGRMEVPES